ncbi:myotonin-protein kinase, partial [Alligator mississippiensis]|uniref:myotonin-protein kinase n=1 Tax=Alligator mississippiensis TaxID=8496 RepID=UPI002877D286
MSAEVRLRRLAALARDRAALGLEALLDLLLCVTHELGASPLAREPYIADFLRWAEPLTTRIRELQLQRDDFEVLKVIGRGAFSEVAVVRMLRTSRIYAMKVMNKWDLLKRREVSCFREERDVLVRGDKRWITELHFAFQDHDYLYLVMEYYAGGDLLTLLSRFADGVPLELARFYLAELVMAIDSVHRLGYVHRDIKPDNVLLDRCGHLRLGDFGSCLKLREDGTVSSAVAVGTPDYLSPEILAAVEAGAGSYGPECDWWALGVFAYELFYGRPPFYADSVLETYGKILHFKEHLRFPAGPAVPEAARALMRGLLCGREARLGRGGAPDFRPLGLFAGLDWDGLRGSTPPFAPGCGAATDTSNFDVLDERLTPAETLSDVLEGAPLGVHLPFVGYSYTCSALQQDETPDQAPDAAEEMECDRGAPPQGPAPPEELACPPPDAPALDLAALLELQGCEGLEPPGAGPALPSRPQEAETRNRELEAGLRRLEAEAEVAGPAQPEEGECPGAGDTGPGPSGGTRRARRCTSGGQDPGAPSTPRGIGCQHHRPRLLLTPGLRGGSAAHRRGTAGRLHPRGDD